MSDFLSVDEILANPIPPNPADMTHRQTQQLIRMARAAGVDLGNANQTRVKRARWAEQARLTVELQKADYHG